MTPESPETFALRRPVPADYQRLIDWIPDGRAARRWAGPDILWPVGTRELALALHREHSAPRSLVDDRGKLAAFGEYYPKAPRRLRLARLIVDPTRRGQRIVDRLIRCLAEAAAKRIEFDTLELGVFVDNTPAVNAYRRLGFIDGEPADRNDIVDLWRPGF